jgi:hypothetical protein
MDFQNGYSEGECCFYPQKTHQMFLSPFHWKTPFKSPDMDLPSVAVLGTFIYQINIIDSLPPMEGTVVAFDGLQKSRKI